MSSRRSAKKSRSKSLPLWLRSAIVVGLIVLTSSLQRVSDTLPVDSVQTESESDDWIADSNALFNRNSLSLTQKQSSLQAIAPEQLQVGDIIFSGNAGLNQGWPRQMLTQLNPHTAAFIPYSQVAVVTANADQRFAVYSSLSLDAEKNAEKGTEPALGKQVIEKMVLEDYLTQIELGQVVVYRLAIAPAQNKTSQNKTSKNKTSQNKTSQNETSQSAPSKTATPEMAAAIAAAAESRYQKSLSDLEPTAKDTQFAQCSQLIQSVYSAMDVTADSACFGIEQLNADERWQQMDLNQAVPAVQSSLD